MSGEGTREPTGRERTSSCRSTSFSTRNRELCISLPENPKNDESNRGLVIEKGSHAGYWHVELLNGRVG